MIILQWSLNFVRPVKLLICTFLTTVQSTCFSRSWWLTLLAWFEFIPSSFLKCEKNQPFLASLCFWRLGICYLLVLKGVGVLPDFAFSLLKVHYHHQRRAAGVNLAPARSAPVRAQWRSCADHSRRGDALLWRGLLPRRGQTAFTNGTQGHKGRGKVHLNGSILFPAGAGCWLGLFERIFFARWKVENRTRRERVRFFFFFFF